MPFLVMFRRYKFSGGRIAPGKTRHSYHRKIVIFQALFLCGPSRWSAGRARPWSTATGSLTSFTPATSGSPVRAAAGRRPVVADGRSACGEGEGRHIRPPFALAHMWIARQRDHEDVALLPRELEIPDVAGVNDVEDPVAVDHGLARPAGRVAMGGKGPGIRRSCGGTSGGFRRGRCARRKIYIIRTSPRTIRARPVR